MSARNHLFPEFKKTTLTSAERVSVKNRGDLKPIDK